MLYQMPLLTLYYLLSYLQLVWNYEKLESEFKKISGQYRNIDKLNKEKLVDYQKKMATLDSEILLTQNLYKSFIDAKSRVVKKQWADSG